MALCFLKLSRVVDTEGFLARVFCFDLGVGVWDSTNVTQEFCIDLTTSLVYTLETCFYS